MLKFFECVAVHDFADLSRVAFCCACDHLGQLLSRGIAHNQLVKESIKLSLRQWIGSLLVDRILGGEHEEWSVQFSDFPSSRHAALLHRFQHSGLGLWSGAIDLIRQNQMCKNRPVLKLKHPFSLISFVHHVCSEHIGRHEVWGELYAIEGQVEYLAEGANQQCFAKPGDALE